MKMKPPLTERKRKKRKFNKRLSYFRFDLGFNLCTTCFENSLKTQNLFCDVKTFTFCGSTSSCTKLGLTSCGDCTNILVTVLVFESVFSWLKKKSSYHKKINKFTYWIY